MKIHELSDLLGIPKSTLRMYEKQGVLRSSICQDNGYHDYSVWDMIFLLEFLKFRKIGFSTAEAAAMLHESDAMDIAQSYERICSLLQGQIDEKIQIIRYLQTKISMIKTAPLNLNHFWYEQIPERIGFQNMKTRHGAYSMDSNEQKFQSQMMDLLPFSDGIIRIPQSALNEPPEKESGTWFSAFDTRFFPRSSLHEIGQGEIWPEHTAFCTIVDAGDLGMFSQALYMPLWSHFQQSSHRLSQPYLYGTILMRAKKNGVMQRLMRLELPIESDTV